MSYKTIIDKEANAALFVISHTLDGHPRGYSFSQTTIKGKPYVRLRYRKGNAKVFDGVLANSRLNISLAEQGYVILESETSFRIFDIRSVRVIHGEIFTPSWVDETGLVRIGKDEYQKWEYEPIARTIEFKNDKGNAMIIRGGLLLEPHKLVGNNVTVNGLLSIITNAIWQGGKCLLQTNSGDGPRGHSLEISEASALQNYVLATGSSVVVRKEDYATKKIRAVDGMLPIFEVLRPA